MKILIVSSEFNAGLSDSLLQSCLDAFAELGVEPTVIRVPGALEIPIMLKWKLASEPWDACVALGVIVRGETDHYHSLARMIEQGVMRLALDYSTSITFEVLMADSMALIESRLEKGRHAAHHAVRMAKLKIEHLHSPKSEN